MKSQNNLNTLYERIQNIILLGMLPYGQHRGDKKHYRSEMVNIKDVIHNLYYCSHDQDTEVKIVIPDIGEYKIARIYQETRDTQWRSYKTLIMIEVEK